MEEFLHRNPNFYIIPSDAGEILEAEALIRFIDFDLFIECGCFPRNPNFRELTLLLDEIDRDSSLLIFISHCWLRPNLDPKLAFPDNDENDKWKLCCDGIAWLREWMAPGMEKCYVWLDYGCIDQDNEDDVPLSLKRYDKTVACCDLIFTPIVDRNWEVWQNEVSSIPMEAYKAMMWNGNHPQAYLSRTWCRVEMFYAANVPLIKGSNGEERHSKFAHGLADSCSNNRRPHFVYGTRENQRELGPIAMLPLQNSTFDEYHPMDGKITDQSDLVKVEALIDVLKYYMLANRVKEEYEGEKNESGLPHGTGTCMFADGSVYSGQWRDGWMHGEGKFEAANGAKYVGGFYECMRHGKGKHTTPNGNEYDGDWVMGVREGKGRMQGPDRDVYEGEFKANKREGEGSYTFASKDVYVGTWRNNLMEGKGKLTLSNGSVYEGDFSDDRFEGEGVYRYIDGDVYTGQFKKGVREGRGVWRYATGEVYDGLWKNGNPIL